MLDPQHAPTSNALASLPDLSTVPVSAASLSTTRHPQSHSGKQQQDQLVSTIEELDPVIQAADNITIAVDSLYTCCSCGGSCHITSGTPIVRGKEAVVKRL